MDIFGTYQTHNQPLQDYFSLIRMDYQRQVKVFRNFTLHDADNHMAFFGQSGIAGGVHNLILDNGSINNLGSGSISSTAGNIEYPFDMDSSNYARIVYVRNTLVTIKNVNISDNVNGVYVQPSQTNYLRQHKECTGIFLDQVENANINNLTMRNNCNFEYYNPYARVNSAYSCTNIVSYSNMSRTTK